MAIRKESSKQPSESMATRKESSKQPSESDAYIEKFHGWDDGIEAAQRDFLEDVARQAQQKRSEGGG